MKIIGLTGFKQCGKSTAADYLVESGWRRRSFAAPIKKMLSAMGMPDSYLYGSDKEKIWPPINQTARHAMQSLGTEWARKLLHPNVWVDLLMFEIDNMPSPKSIVIDDVRFDNEADAIKQRGGLIVRIQHLNPSTDIHPSERGITSIKEDLTYVNMGSLEDLQKFIINTAVNYDSIRRT